MSKETPSASLWLREAKAAAAAADCGMYLLHNGVVRKSAKKTARDGEAAPEVVGMDFSYDAAKVAKAVEDTERLPGISCVRVWLNEGRLAVGDDIMYVLVGGDIRPRVADALLSLVETIKTKCVSEQELTAERQERTI